jgi:hypothetical protein
MLRILPSTPGTTSEPPGLEPHPLRRPRIIAAIRAAYQILLFTIVSSYFQFDTAVCCDAPLIIKCRRKSVYKIKERYIKFMLNFR